MHRPLLSSLVRQYRHGRAESIQRGGYQATRHDAVDKVTGRARFGADIQMPGLLYGKLLRSPHAHARICSLDTSKAE